MKRVKITRQPKGLYENKPFPEAGETAEFDDSVADSLVRFKYGVDADSDEATDKAAESEAPYAVTPADPAQNPVPAPENGVDAPAEKAPGNETVKRGENPADKRETRNK